MRRTRFRTPARSRLSTRPAACRAWKVFALASRPPAGFLSSVERTAAFRRQGEPDLGSLRNRILGGGDDAQCRAVRGFDHVVAACPEKHLACHGGLDRILRDLLRLRRKLDVVLADRHPGTFAAGEVGPHHLLVPSGKIVYAICGG